MKEIILDKFGISPPFCRSKDRKEKVNDRQNSHLLSIEKQRKENLSSEPDRRTAQIRLSAQDAHVLDMT